MHVNVSGSRNTENESFQCCGETLETVEHFKYLGVFFSSNRKFSYSVTKNVEQATKAMYSLLRDCSRLDLNIESMLHLFDHTYLMLKLLKPVSSHFFKQILKLRKTTPSAMVYGESGKAPVYVRIQQRVVNYWHKLESSTYENIAHKLLRVALLNISKFSWPSRVKAILNSIGLSNVFRTPNAFSVAISYSETKTDWSVYSKRVS